MKDIKSYVIGFLTCACLFLIMGQTKSENQFGKYQAFKGRYMINTATGKMWEWKDEPDSIAEKKNLADNNYGWWYKPSEIKD